MRLIKSRDPAWVKWGVVSSNRETVWFDTQQLAQDAIRSRMAISMKETCERCRAAGHDGSCELGYNNRGEWIKGIGTRRIKPQEPCPKPLTIDELFAAPKKIEGVQS